MDDTPEHIKQWQLAIWLSKTPAQRLRQFMEDNDAMYRFWNSMKKAYTTDKENKEYSDSVPPAASFE